MKVLSLLVAGFIGFIAMPSFNAAEVEKPETYITTVSAGQCHNMKRDTEYATPYYVAGSNGYVFNKTTSCEDKEVADGYNGTGDMRIRDSEGKSRIHKQYKIAAGESKTISTYLSSYAQARSTISWEVIDGEDIHGSKLLYASVE